MNSFLELIHSLVGGVVYAVRWPLSSFSPLTQLIVLSAISGVILLMIYGRVSNQRAIRRVKDKIYAGLLEVILFRHNLRLCLKAQARMLGYGFIYFCYAVPPLLVLLIPCVVLLAHLNVNYNYRPLQIGERAIVRVKVEDSSILDKLTLSLSQGLQATQALRVPAKNEIYWRIEPTTVEKAQFAKLALQDATSGTVPAELQKTINVGTQTGPIFAETFKSWWSALLYPDPGRGVLSALDKISEVSVSYPSAKYSVGGYTLHWIVVFFLVSLLSGLVASKFMGVEI